MNSTSRKWLVALLPLLGFLPSCGYHPGYSEISGRYRSVSIPYVAGDVDGSFTSALVREIANSSAFRHASTGGELLLIVKLIDIGDENIGFRYDQLHHHHDKHALIPVETRLIMSAEVSLLEAATECAIMPSVQLSASIDFDHEYNSTYHNDNVFSLGQLSDADSAFCVARVPLTRRLAQKIIEYLTYL